MIASKRNSLGQRKPSDKHGSVLGPRRAGLISPTAYAGLVAWYDASDAASVTVATGGVSNWADKTGLGGRDLVQATEASRPIYVATYSPDQLVTGANSTFASDTGFWTKVGSTISGGKANFTAGTALSKSGLTTVGRLYRVTFTVSDFSFGGVNPSFNDGVALIQSITGNGSYSFTYRANVSDVVFSANTSSFSVTDVTVGAVGENALVYFDGIDDFLKTAAFTLGQPTTVYIVWTPVTWTFPGDCLIDGLSGAGLLWETDTGSDNWRIFAGASLAANFPLGGRNLGTAVLNGASSLLKRNAGTGTSGNAGTSSMGGVSLGTNSGNTVFGNVAVNEIAIYNTAHTAAQQAQFWQYAKRKWGIVG